MGKPQITAKTERKKTVPKSAWKPGQSGNPGGRPKNEQSISHWLSEFGNLTPPQLADQCVQYAAELKKVKGDMPIFAHIALRALMGQINEPTPGLFALILERTEGKVPDKLELSWRDKIKSAGFDPEDTLQQAIENVTPKLLTAPDTLPLDADLQEADIRHDAPADPQ